MGNDNSEISAAKDVERSQNLSLTPEDILGDFAQYIVKLGKNEEQFERQAALICRGIRRYLPKELTLLKQKYPRERDALDGKAAFKSLTAAAEILDEALYFVLIRGKIEAVIDWVIHMRYYDIQDDGENYIFTLRDESKSPPDWRSNEWQLLFEKEKRDAYKPEIFGGDLEYRPKEQNIRQRFVQHLVRRDFDPKSAENTAKAFEEFLCGELLVDKEEDLTPVVDALHELRFYEKLKDYWPPERFVGKKGTKTSSEDRLRWYLEKMKPFAEAGWLNSTVVSEEFGRAFVNLMDRALKNEEIKAKVLPRELQKCITMTDLIDASGGPDRRKSLLERLESHASNSEISSADAEIASADEGSSKFTRREAQRRRSDDQDQRGR